ncbi:cytochrome c-type biogenesis protein [Paracoccus isoporae]|uniref:Cytochrome c-type biogenesis protein n=1 Tax=Paracoccus isoporae TaxID=591205 RepID=A0A1G6WI97_9RHOB|nr:cytochrome c biogenesis protein CcdA [Paracoccus isoporae]SDD65489.1 cytochrome c-type biogenesis protein [Paracoccus isoporae]
MTDLAAIDAYLAGLLSFLSPCVLPVLPFFLCLLAGRGLPGWQGAGFGAGFGAVFLLSCLGATRIGQIFIAWHAELRLLAGAVLIVAAFRVLSSGRAAGRSGIIRAVLLGLAFGFGWTACVGPSLSALIALARSEALTGTALLSLYAAGMVTPFVVMASLTAALPRPAGLLRKGSALGLAIFALLIATDRVNRIAQFLLERADWSATLI